MSMGKGIHSCALIKCCLVCYPIITTSNFDLTHILVMAYLVCQNVSKKLTWSVICSTGNSKMDFTFIIRELYCLVNLDWFLCIA